MTLAGKAKLLRIHVGEDDRWHGKKLYEAIVERCRDLDMAGATVYRGIEGYGTSTLIHRAGRLGRSSDAPVVVTVVDTEENIRRLLPALDEMVHEGMIAVSDVEVVRYSHEGGKRN